MGSPKACSLSINRHSLYPTAFCEDQHPNNKSLSRSTELREGPSADESLLPSLTSVTISSTFWPDHKPPCSEQGHQHLLLLPHTLEDQSGNSFLSLTIPISCPVPSQSPTGSQPHRSPAIHTAIMCLSYVNMTPDHHWGTWSHQATQTARPEAQAADMAMRLSPWLPASFPCDHRRATHPLCTHTQAFVKLMTQMSYSSSPLHHVHHCGGSTEAVREVAHCTSLTPVTVSTKINWFI